MPPQIFPGISTIEALFGSRFRAFVNYHLRLGVTYEKIMQLSAGRYPDAPEAILDAALSLVRQSRAVAADAPGEGTSGADIVPTAPRLPGGDRCEVTVEVHWIDEDTDEQYSLTTVITADTMPNWSQIYALAREEMPPGRPFHFHGELEHVGEHISDLVVIPISIWGNC